MMASLSGEPAPSPAPQERAPFFEALVAYHDRGTTPLHTPGPADVSVSTGGTTSTLSGGFTFVGTSPRRRVAR